MSRIHAKIPEPNDNITMTVGTKILVESVFSDTGLDGFLDGLKRRQGNSVSAETVALVANSVEMTGLSVSGDSTVYRTVERLGENSDDIVRFLAKTLKERYGVCHRR